MGFSTDQCSLCWEFTCPLRWSRWNKHM